MAPVPMEEFERQFIAYMSQGMSPNEAMWKVTGRGAYWLAWWLARLPIAKRRPFAAQIEGGLAILEGLTLQEMREFQASWNEMISQG